MDSLPPYFNSGIFNTSAFYTEKDYLTKDEADKLYLSINTSNNFAALIGVIPGIASASKALIVDTNRDINNINQLSLTGKLVLDQTQSIGFYRNTSTLDINSYIAPETGNTANLTLYSLRGNGSIKVLANNSGTNPLFLVNATSSTTPSTTDYLRILGNGNIGISNNNPAYLLDVSGSINSNSNIQVNRTTNGECFIANNGTVRTTIHCQTSQAHIGTTTNHSFNIQTNGANRLFILNNGNCGIDTSTPACKLDLNGTMRVLSGTTDSPSTGKGLEFSYSSIENKGNIYSFDRTAVAYQTLNLNDRMTILGNGNIGIGITNPTYQLELASGGTGINTSSLKFDGTTFNQNYYISMLLGGAEANKAVVLNSDKDYSGIRNLSITGGFIASTSIASSSITCNTITGNNGAGSSILNLAYTTLNLNGTAMTSTASELNYVDVSPGISTASKALVMNTSNKIGSIGELGFSALSLNYKTVMRASTLPSSAGIEIYDTQFQTPTNQPIINFKTGNNDIPIFFRLCGYLNDNTTVTANGMPFDISYNGGLSYTSGLRISAINTTQAIGSNYNVVLAARNGTIPHVVVNDSKNQLHLFPQSNAEINTSYAQNVIVGSDLFVRKTLQVGTSQDTARLISALDNTQGTGTSKYFCLGREANANNQAEISFYYNAAGSNQNRLDLGFYGGAIAYLRADGRLGLNNSNPRATLDVVGTSIYTIVPFATNTYIYNVSNNTWNNLGGGPVSITIAAFFSDDIYVQNSVYTSSDRRLKENIQEIDIDIDRYKLLKPSSYNYKNQADKTKIGLIAQDVMNVCGEAITYTENENMKSSDLDEPEGIQLGMDYSAITVLNVAIIKKLIDKINILEEKLLRNNII